MILGLSAPRAANHRRSLGKGPRCYASVAGHLASRYNRCALLSGGAPYVLTSSNSILLKICVSTKVRWGSFVERILRHLSIFSASGAIEGVGYPSEEQRHRFVVAISAWMTQVMLTTNVEHTKHMRCADAGSDAKLGTIELLEFTASGNIPKGRRWRFRR